MPRRSPAMLNEVNLRSDLKVIQPANPHLLDVRIHRVGIQVGVLTLYDRRVAGWILRYAQDDK
jgi:hypothetical protein